MENYKEYLENEFDSNQDEGQLFIEFINTIRRQKRYFLSFGLVTFLLTGLVLITRQKIWQGEFQIVVSETKKKNPKDSLMSNSQSMLSLVGLGSNKSRLFTEIKILESPSVLMPVFEIVNKRSIDQNGSALKFKSWVDSSLSIENIRKTSILNISYKDKNREFVKEVLDKLSTTYQDYSSRDRNRGINQSIKYLDSQITLYQKRSQESLTAEQTFSSENDLSILLVEDRSIRNEIKQQIKSMKAFDQPTKVNSQINVEVLRVRYNNELRELKSKLAQVQSLDDKNSVDIIVRQALVPELAPKARYKSWRDDAKKYLEARIVANNAKLSSLERPKDVLIKYRELLRETARDNNILKMLEEEKQRIKLEKAQAEDPWELISEPTVSKKPVSPSKKSYFIFGLFSSFILGSLAANLKEKREGIIYSISELKRRIPGKYLGLISNYDFEKKVSILNTIIDKAVEEKQMTSIIFVGFENQTLNLESFNIKYKDEINKGLIKLSKDYNNVIQNSNHIIISKLGGITIDEVNRLRQHYLITSKSISGHLIS